MNQVTHNYVTIHKHMLLISSHYVTCSLLRQTAVNAKYLLHEFN